MNIHDYCIKGGKNLIKEYLNMLPDEERFEGYFIRHKIMVDGIQAFQGLNIRQLRGKLWEIKFSHERIMYMIKDSDNVYFLHICRKQKGKAEKHEIETALKRAREAGF